MSNELQVLEKIKMELEIRESSLNLFWREAALFAKSEVVPATFKNKPENCYIAIDMARNMKMPPLTVMQNMYLVYGNPSFKTSFMVSRFNTQGRFAPLRYRFTGDKGKDSWGCIAYAKEIETGEIIEGTEITISMSKSEGWYSKSGSKWVTMPEQMLQYRAAAFFIRVHCPEILNGMQTMEEIEDSNDTITKDVTDSLKRVDIELDIKNNANTGDLIEITSEDKKEKKPKEDVEKKVEGLTADEIFKL